MTGSKPLPDDAAAPAAPWQPDPTAIDPGLPPPPGVDPPGVYRANYTPPVVPEVPLTASSTRRRGVMVVALGAVVALLLKVVVPILVGASVSGVLTGVFGGPYDRLPTEQKQALEERFRASTGDTFDGLSDAERSSKVDAMFQSGLPRLSDELLVEKVHLTAKMLNAADASTCARVARATATGAADPDAVLVAVEGLDSQAVGRWYEIAVSAIEAAANQAPAQRTVVQAESDRVLGNLFARFSAVEARQIADLSGGTATDADACAAIRAFYTQMERLPAADLSIAALADSSPP